MFVGSILPPPCGGGAAREKARKIACSSNLKEINIALTNYSLEYSNSFPSITKPGESGFIDLSKIYPTKNLPENYGNAMKGYSSANFEALRLEGYLSNTKLFKCPSNEDAAVCKKNKVLTNKTNSYAYTFGLNKKTSKPNTAIISDSISLNIENNVEHSNHEYYGNILFIDISIRGFKGPKWYTNSNYWINKPPTKKMQKENEL